MAARKPIRLLLVGDMARVYKIRAGGHTHLVVAPPDSLHEIVPAVRQAAMDRQVAWLKFIKAETSEVVAAQFPDPDFDVTGLELIGTDTLLILPSALKHMKPERTPRKKGKKLASPLKRAKRPMSQETKDKISAAMRAKRDAKQTQSLLRAVAGAGPDIPAPAQPA